MDASAGFKLNRKGFRVVLRLAPNEPIPRVSSHSHFRFRFNSNGNLRDICEHPTAFRDPNGAGPAATRSGQGRLALASLPERATERNRSRTAPAHEPADLLLAHHNISIGQSNTPYVDLKYKYTLRLSNTCSSILPVAWRVWFSPRYCFSLNVFSALAAFSTFCP